MKTRNGAWVGALALAALLAAGCGSQTTGSTTSGSRTTPTATANPIGSPTPNSQLGRCQAPSNPCLALVTLRGSASVVVRDITDIAHPRTVSSLGAVSGPQFVSGTELSYANSSGLYRALLAGSPKALVASGASAGTWNPDGTAVVYTTSTVDSETGMETVTVHQLKAGHDQVLGSIPGAGAGGCESIASCQIPNFLDFRLLYSPDGTMVSLVTTAFSGSSFRVWSASDGRPLSSSDVQGRTMSVWSGSSLYFQDNTGVQVWRHGVISSFFIPGAKWVKPQGSPGGSLIVFTFRDAKGWGHIYTIDTTTGFSRDLRSHRTDAVFLTSRYLWYKGERECVAADKCGPKPPFHPESGKTYIYDLQYGTETESIITSVADVWPHAA